MIILYCGAVGYNVIGVTCISLDIALMLALKSHENQTAVGCKAHGPAIACIQLQCVF